MEILSYEVFYGGKRVNVGCAEQEPLHALCRCRKICWGFEGVLVDKKGRRTNMIS